MPVSKKRKAAQQRRPTPPRHPDPAKTKGPSPTWYVALMFGLMGVGALLIIINYIGVLPSGTTTTALIVGLAMIAAGFGMTMNYR